MQALRLPRCRPRPPSLGHSATVQRAKQQLLHDLHCKFTSHRPYRSPAAPRWHVTVRELTKLGHLILGRHFGLFVSSTAVSRMHSSASSLCIAPLTTAHSKNTFFHYILNARYDTPPHAMGNKVHFELWWLAASACVACSSINRA